MDLFITKLLGFMLVLTRISAIFLALPIFGSQAIPMRIKIAITLLLSIFFASVAPCGINFHDVNLTQAVLLLNNEAIFGLALGLIAACIFLAVKVSVEMIENQMGFAMAEILDPLTGENAQPLSGLIETIFILLFLVANGHQLLLSVISRSYDVFPVGSIPDVSLLIAGIINATSTMLVVALRLAAPLLAAFLVMTVILAVFSRIIPDMDILFLSMPLNIGLGLILAAIFLPFINEFVAEFADLLGKMLPL